MTVEQRTEYETAEKSVEVTICDECNVEIEDDPVTVLVDPKLSSDTIYEVGRRLPSSLQEIEDPEVRLSHALGGAEISAIAVAERHYHEDCAISKFNIDEDGIPEWLGAEFSPSVVEDLKNSHRKEKRELKKKYEDPPSRLEWFLQGAAVVGIIVLLMMIL